MSKDIERKRKIVEKLRENTIAVKGVELQEKIKTHSVSSMLENKVCRLIFFENELKEMEQKYEGRKKIVLEKLDKIENPLYKDILFLRYICFEKWEDIADTLGYSIDHTFTLHRKAKKILENLTVHNSK